MVVKLSGGDSYTHGAVVQLGQSTNLCPNKTNKINQVQ